MRENSPLVFKYADIVAEGGLSLELEPDPAGYADLYDLPVAVNKVRLELALTVGPDSVFLAGKVRAELRLECSRCAEPLVRSFEDSFDEVYPDTVEYIDTRELIRETAGLLAPMKVLCSENCRGRCLVCGANRNRLVCACKTEKASPFEALKGLKLPEGGKPRKKKKDI
ncbi:MAG: DUF177 domain-containing protein [Elusimicrobia bacterium]|nr:DUF177 domain-containing protein [Elusimicrobiota bacterium]